MLANTHFEDDVIASLARDLRIQDSTGLPVSAVDGVVTLRDTVERSHLFTQPPRMPATSMARRRSTTALWSTFPRTHALATRSDQSHCISRSGIWRSPHSSWTSRSKPTGSP